MQTQEEMNNEELVKAGNAMINYLEPEELDRYAEAEQKLAQAKDAKARMVEEAKARNISGWRDRADDEQREIVSQMPLEEQEAVWMMSPEELRKFDGLYGEMAEAYFTLSDLLRIAAQRAP
jgi:hypothetical protein